MTSSPIPIASGADRSAEFRSWLHQLRNELNAITMANAVAAAMLNSGGGAEAEKVLRNNLGRVSEACRRCSTLLGEAPGKR